MEETPHLYFGGTDMVHINEKHEKVREAITMLEKAKQVWDTTLDVSEVADALGIWREEAHDLIRLIITDEQIKQLQDEEWD